MMDKTTKFKQAGFTVIKIILLIFVLILLFFQLEKAEFSIKKIQVTNPSAIMAAIFLLPFNWYFEFLKWKVVLKSRPSTNDSKTIRNSFFAGIVTGMITPNMLGNFLGRIYYFERKDRIPLTLWTLISNYAQFLITTLYGILAFFLYQNDQLKISEKGILFLPLLGVALIVAYYYYDRLLSLFSFLNNKLLKRLMNEKKDNDILTRLLVFSLCRYLVFLLQFALLLKAFGGEWSTQLFYLIMQYYFILTFFPSLFLGKFLVRDSVAIMVLGGVAASNEIVLSASISVWVINLFIPTILALFIINYKKSS